MESQQNLENRKRQRSDKNGKCTLWHKNTLVCGRVGGERVYLYQNTLAILVFGSKFKSPIPWASIKVKF